MSMDWSKKRKKVADDEEAKLSDALLEFQAEFGQASSVAQPKTFLRGSVVEGSKTLSKGSEGSVYAPKFSLTIASKTSNVGSKDFEEAKKLAAAKARRMLEDAVRSKNINVVPKVVVPPTKPLQRPPKPGSLKAKAEKTKMSNLELFKMELQRVQEDREKRKDMRYHSDVQETDRAPTTGDNRDNPYMGTGEFDNDPYTTNVYVSNIPHSVTEEDLLFTFGSFGPLAALKILYPRNEEERRRPHICAFVAFMARKDLDRFMNEVRLIVVRNDAIRFAYARPVTIPALPYYIPPQLLQLQCPDAPSGLPFNAQPVKEEAEAFLLKYKSFPPLNVLPPPEHPAYDDFMKLIKNSTVRVVIPPDRGTLRLINRTAIYVVTEGAHFEAMICSQEFNNPMFMFLWDNTSACHVYYRWRMYSILQGDSLLEWRREKFRMFKDGSWWIPPNSSAELNKSMPECLYNTTCIQVHPDRWMRNGKGKRQSGEDRRKLAEMDRKERAKEAEKARMKKKEERKKSALTEKSRDKLEKIIREMTPEQNSIGEAMVWCIEHSTFAKEICETIYESLTFDETPLFKKIARLYLINDILSNCMQRLVRDVFLFRSNFERLLDKIFIALGKTYKKIESRIKQEQFKQRVMNIFRHWEETALYPTDRLIHHQNIFLGLVVVSEDNAEDDNELDGLPIESVTTPRKSDEMEHDGVDDDDIDGIPLEEDASGEKAANSNKFKPIAAGSAVKASSSGLFSSKWDDLSGNAKASDDEIDGIELIPDTSDTPDRNSLSPGEIKDVDDKRRSFTTPSRSDVAVDDERRRKLIRDVEVRAMTLLDDLESDRDPDAKRKVDEFRKVEMAKVEKILLTEPVSSSSKKEKKERDRGSSSAKKDKKRDRSRSRSKDREKARDRDRDRERDRDRDRDRERRSHRDRSSDRDRDRERDRDRRHR